MTGQKDLVSRTEEESQSAPHGPETHIKFPLLFAAAAFFIIVMIAPTPKGLIALVQEERPIGYQLQSGTTTITQSVNKILGTDLSPEGVAYKAKVMVAILLAAAFLWGTEAIPLGATDLLVGSLLYLFTILPLDSISKAYMTDAVFFIFGVLAIAVGVSNTGLDRRIGLTLLARVRGLKSFCFIFFPLLAVMAGFLSEHALVAILVPVLLRIYRLICDYYNVKSDRALAVLLLLGICFACNQGGPGSPSAGGRNAIMVGYFSDYGKPIAFVQWVMYAMPYVIILSFAVAAYMYFAFRNKIAVRNIDFRKFMGGEMKKLGRASQKERLMGLILLVVVGAWITSSKRFGLGGPCIVGLVLMLIFRIIDWHDIQARVRFDVVGLYAAACAMGVGLKVTGASIWVAETIINMLPSFLREGPGLIVAVSSFTGVLTNFMSDGATVAAVGPIALSMAQVARVHLWKLGLACAFSSSFANASIVGTPNNAIAYVGGIDPKTGERLLKLRDFVIYGIPVTIIALVILWGWAAWGYWRLMPWN